LAVADVLEAESVLDELPCDAATATPPPAKTNAVAIPPTTVVLDLFHEGMSSPLSTPRVPRDDP